MRYTLIFNPPTAKNLAREGFSKDKIKKYIAENKKIRAVLPKNQLGFTPKPRFSQPDPDKDGMIPVIRDPQVIRVIVGGGPGAFVAHLMGGGPTPGKKEFQKIDLPKNWDKLVAKYKNVVPTYAKY
jgi:hypothetical protein